MIFNNLWQNLSRYAGNGNEFITFFVRITFSRCAFKKASIFKMSLRNRRTKKYGHAARYACERGRHARGER